MREEGDWEYCWDCGGEGFYYGICQCEDFEDTCCCAVPTPATCRTCQGKGGLIVDHSAEDRDG